MHLFAWVHHAHVHPSEYNVGAEATQIPACAPTVLYNWPCLFQYLLDFAQLPELVLS
jgi:hypothetical protein